MNATLGIGLIAIMTTMLITMWVSLNSVQMQGGGMRHDRSGSSADVEYMEWKIINE